MSRASRLWLVLALNLVLVAGLVSVGMTAHSLGVLAEGADYLADAGAISVSLLALWLSARPPTARRPRGHPYATAIAAAVNGGWLLVLSLLVVGGSIDRLIRGARHVDGLAVVIASAIACVVMVIGALILDGDVDSVTHPDSDELNMRAVLLDTAADAASAAGVAIAGGIILATGGWYWLDPAVALAISVVVAYHATRLLRRVAYSVSAR